VFFVPSSFFDGIHPFFLILCGLAYLAVPALIWDAVEPRLRRWRRRKRLARIRAAKAVTRA